MSGNTIKVVRDGQLVSEVELLPQMVIGRSPQADVQLEDPQMSRVHASITKEGERYFLTDMSTNGILLNGERIQKQAPTELSNGSVAQFTTFELQFEIGAGEEIPKTRKIEESPSSEDAIAKLSAPPPSAPLPAGPASEGAPGGASIWSGQASLKVVDIIEETDDVKTFRLVGEDACLFSFKPGQFATLAVDIDGKEVKRSYSISSSPSRPHTLEMTIKRVPGGLVSNWMNDNVKLGDELRIKGPAGKFSCFNYPSQKILLVAAGSGITPIMSMSRWIVDTAADVDVVMLYSARTPSDIIFRKELELLAARHSGFRVYITVTKGWRSTESWTGLSGRTSCEMLRMACPDFLDRHVFMCGPKPFADCVKDQLKELDFPLANLHMESFGSGRVAKGAKKKDEVADVPVHSQQHSVVDVPVGPEPTAAGGAASSPPAQAGPATGGEQQAGGAVDAPEPFKVEFKSSGVVARTDGQSALLDLAEVNGVDIDYACRAGSCLSCKVKCLAGDVAMSEDAELEDEERDAGYILACCSTPLSDLLIEEA